MLVYTLTYCATTVNYSRKSLIKCTPGVGSDDTTDSSRLLFSISVDMMIQNLRKKLIFELFKTSKKFLKQNWTDFTMTIVLVDWHQKWLLGSYLSTLVFDFQVFIIFSSIIPWLYNQIGSVLGQAL
jgi:hypothetical protein